MRKLLILASLAGAVLGLAACDNGPSAVKSQKTDRSVAARSAADDDIASDATATAKTDPRDAPVPKVDGKPMWSANSKYTAQENAERAFDRNGEAFGARNVDEFVEKAHAFVSDPPAGAETIKRANGDRLIYDAKSNVFAVATKAGAPRTMFKPDDGPAYWREQKTREAKRTGGGNDGGRG